MNNNQTLLIFGRKDPNFQVLKKVVEIYFNRHEKQFTLKELLCQDSFIWTEKKALKNIFGGHYLKIVIKDFDFNFNNGKWSFINTDTTHHYITKILNSVNIKLGCKLYPNDLKLIEALVDKNEKIFAKEWEDEFEHEAVFYETNQEMLEFISKGLEQKVGKVCKLDYKFIKEFLETFYDYDEMLMCRELENMC